MPVLFAVQQICEGVVWLSFGDPVFERFRQVAMYIFLAIAQAGWPLFIPLFVLVAETNAKRKKILAFFAGAGVIAAVFFTWCLLQFDARIGMHPYHIQYDLDFPLSHTWYYGILYFIPAMLPTFVSSLKPMRILGALLFCSYLISRIFFHDFIVSVWCFFGALSSLTSLSVILEMKKKKLNRPAAD